MYPHLEVKKVDNLGTHNQMWWCNTEVCCPEYDTCKYVWFLIFSTNSKFQTGKRITKAKLVHLQTTKRFSYVSFTTNFSTFSSSTCTHVTHHDRAKKLDKKLSNVLKFFVLLVGKNCWAGSLLTPTEYGCRFLIVISSITCLPFFFRFLI